MYLVLFLTDSRHKGVVMSLDEVKLKYPVSGSIRLFSPLDGSIKSYTVIGYNEAGSPWHNDCVIVVRDGEQKIFATQFIR